MELRERTLEQYYHALTIGPHFMWFQKADLDELNNRLLYSILLS